MTDNNPDTGLITVLLERLRTQRLPRVLRLQEKVERGERLDEFDIAFLGEMLADAEKVRPLFDRNPELAEIGAKMVSLYASITGRALENEGGPQFRPVMPQN